MRRRTFLRLSAVSTLTAAAAGGTFGGVRAAPARVRLMGKVLIVGGGFAGSACALALRRLNPAVEVTLVDPDDPYVSCPMSNSVLVGLRELTSISVSRRGLARAGVNVVRDRVGAIDTRLRRARLDGGAVLAYD